MRLGRGLTNAEIGRRLFLAESTVRNTLTCAIYPKAGIEPGKGNDRGRVMLTRWWLESQDRPTYTPCPACNGLGLIRAP